MTESFDNSKFVKSEVPYSLLPTPYSLLPTPYSRFPTPYSLLPTPYSLFPLPLIYTVQSYQHRRLITAAN
ncbi:MAG: hypothetical protein F6K49_27065 [Moorea sp. SIO3I6]|nr:hypothetical protein [Moorena sp. SIO3I6]